MIVVDVVQGEAGTRHTVVKAGTYRIYEPLACITCERDVNHRMSRESTDIHNSGRDRTLMEGLDIVTIDPSAALICRVDGFFGHPTPINNEATDVPAELLRVVESHTG